MNEQHITNGAIRTDLTKPLRAERHLDERGLHAQAQAPTDSSASMVSRSNHYDYIGHDPTPPPPPAPPG